MKKIYSIILLFTSIIGFGQCPPSNVVLTSQTQVDAFATNYPNCEIIQGFLILNGNDIEDISPLSSINTVGSILINGTSLQSMQGLEGLTINGLGVQQDAFIVIENNPLLQDIFFLSNYTVNVPVVFLIRNMSALSSLEGANTINEFVTIYLENNDVLTSLNGLNNNLNIIGGLVQAPYVYISQNDILSDISRLNTAQWNGALSAEITDNAQLSVCENNLVCALISNNAITIQNNAAGCSSLAEVSLQCGLIPSNDDCDNALPLTIGETIQAYNALGTASPQIPSCNDLNRIDVWFKLNSGDLSALDITVDADYNFQVWEGPCDDMTQIPNACASVSMNAIEVNTNTEYHLQVWSNANDGRFSGLFNLLVEDATLSVTENRFNDFRLFPNPIKDVLNFKSLTPIDTLEIYTILGQLVKVSKPNLAHFDVDMSSLNVGLYVVKVRINDAVKTYKVLKE